MALGEVTSSSMEVGEEGRNRYYLYNKKYITVNHSVVMCVYWAGPVL